MCISAISQTWVEMVPKDVMAWRKVRASAWKLISGVSSGVRLSEDNLKQQKMSHIYHLLRHSSEIHIDYGRFNPLQSVGWLAWHVNSILAHYSRFTTIGVLLLQAVGELGGKIVTTGILQLMNEDVKLAFVL